MEIGISDIQETIDFVKLVVTTLQTDYHTPKDGREALTNLLEVADELHVKLTNTPLVRRGPHNILHSVTGGNPLYKI